MKRFVTLVLVGFIGLAALPQVGFAAVSLSQTNLTVAQGQSLTVYAYGQTGSLYVSTNQNPSVASVSVSGSQITVYGITSGSTWITICDQFGQYTCAMLSVTVSGFGNGTNSTVVGFGQTNPVLAVGQNLSVTLYGGSGSYYLPSYSNSIVQGSINGSTLSLYGATPGTASLSVCSYNGGCSSLNVTVNSGNQYGYSYGTNQNSSAILLQIQQLEALLAQLKSQVSQPVYGGTVLGTSNYKFYSHLGFGSYGSDVTALQQRLIVEGVYSGPVTGYYGILTTAAVRRYQTVRALQLTGTLDTATRAMLNGSWY